MAPRVLCGLVRIAGFTRTPYHRERRLDPVRAARPMSDYLARQVDLLAGIDRQGTPNFIWP